MKTQADRPFNYEKVVLENLSDIIVITDLDNKVRLWNAFAEKYYAIPQAEALGKNMTELVQFNYPKYAEKEDMAGLAHRKHWEGKVFFTNQKGQAFYLSQRLSYIVNHAGKEIGILWVGKNIVEKLPVQQNVQENTQFYKALIADSLDTILLMNAEGTITFASPGVKPLLGYGVDKIIGTNGFSYIHPDDVSYAIESFQKEIEEKPEI